MVNVDFLIPILLYSVYEWGPRSSHAKAGAKTGSLLFR